MHTCKNENNIIINERLFKLFKKNNINLIKEEAEKRINIFFKNNPGCNKLSKDNRENPLKLTLIKIKNELYILDCKLGKGSYAKVRKAYNCKSGNIVAIKISKFHKNDFESKIITEKESRILQKQNKYRDELLISYTKRIWDSKINKKNNIIKKYIKGKDLGLDKHYLCLDFAENTLHGFADKNQFNIKDKLLLCFFVTKALAELHDKDIIHSDVLPKNIGVNFSNGKIKNIWLFDFGISGELKGKDYLAVSSFQNVGLFHPFELGSTTTPELLKNLESKDNVTNSPYIEFLLNKTLSYKPEISIISKKTDMFTLANTFYFILTGGYVSNNIRYKLFYDSIIGNESLKQKFLSQKFLNLGLISEEFKKLLLQMINSDQNLRPNLEEIQNVLLLQINSCNLKSNIFDDSLIKEISNDINNNISNNNQDESNFNSILRVMRRYL